MDEKKVFILNYNERHDYTMAEGTKVIVTEGVQPVFKISKITETIKKSLKDFKKDDILLLSGPNILHMIAAVYLLNKFDVINVYIHDATRELYVLKKLDKSEIIKEEV